MRILGYILVVLFVTTSAFGQQINPVPDYIFRYQMSVGRNAPTDTAAYLSVGPRYGANKGLMPPMVVDTNAVTGVKRNGLLIFSVQLNNFAYWDSTTSRFRKITAEAVVDSVLFATRAWRKKGDDSLGAVISQRTDTALLSTKAYRQKAVDSLVTLISTLGGGTVLSVSAGTGMNFTTITTSGSVSADTNVLATRANRDKLKDSLQANIAGKVNISDTSTMLSAYLRKADTTAMLTPYLRKTDTTAMLTPYVRIAGFGLTKGTQTLSVDSALMATRARVQKGIDSVASLVTTTDSVVFSTRAWRQKGVDSVAALANTKATATGTTNYLSKFTGTSSLGNSIVYATTSEVGISTPSPTHPLDVNGRVRVRTIDSTATGMNMLYADVDGVIKKAAPPAGGTVTSVSAGTGMSFTTITTTGAVSADTVALATRAWRQKGIDSLANVRVGGSGTTNRVAKFTASGTVGDGSIADSSSSVRMTILNNGRIGVNTAVDAGYQFDISGNLRTTTGADFATTSGTVGIGTTSILSKLNILAVSNDTIPAVRILESANGTQGQLFLRGGAQAGVWYDFTRNGTNGQLEIQGNQSGFNNIALAPTSGSVGIGTAPTERLDVNGSIRARTIDSSASPINVLWADNNGVIRKTTPAIIGTGTTNRVPKFTASGTLGNSQIFDNGSSIGINTTSPQATLHLTNSAGTHTQIWGNPGAGGSYAYMELRRSLVDGAFRFGTGQGGFSDITFATSPTDSAFTERMRIKTDGEILIGTTTDAGNFRLQVNGDIMTNSRLQLKGTVNHWEISAVEGDTLLTIVQRLNNRKNWILDTAGRQWFGNLLNNQGGDAAMAIRAKEKEVSIGDNVSAYDQGNYQLQVKGHTYIDSTLTVKKFDSTASAINMLYADASGVIKKTAVPAGSIDSVKMRSNTITAASGWTIGEETANNTSINQVVRTQDLASNTTVHVNTILYKTTNTFTTGSWVTIGTVPVGYRPTNVVYFSLPNLVDGASFQATNDTDFTAVAQYSGGTSLRIKANGEIDVYVTTVDASADLSGANYVLIPVVVSYPILTLTN